MNREFGTLEDGSKVEEITLKKGALEAKILTYGAIVRDLKFNERTVVLGFDNLDSYLKHSPFFGAVPGRCANRINLGKFTLDGKDYQLGTNGAGKHHLHGGFKNFGKRNWSIEQQDKASVLLKLVSEDGDENYPGRAEVLCRYTLTGTGALRAKFSATCDQTTLINLTQHSYFNLDGGDDILDHTVEIMADRYLPVTDEFIPTGEIRNVEWTSYDFRNGRKIRRKAGEEDVIFDHNFCLADKARDKAEFIASVEGPESGVRMEVWSTEPGVQLYDGFKIDIPVPGLDGKTYGKHAGLCLEPQRWPDSINHENFTDVLLHPGETYSHVTEFRFS